MPSSAITNQLSIIHQIIKIGYLPIYITENISNLLIKKYTDEIRMNFTFYEEVTFYIYEKFIISKITTLIIFLLCALKTDN